MSEIKALISRLNPTTRKALETAISRCFEAKHYAIENEHFLEALLAPQTEVTLAFEHFGLDVERARNELHAALATLNTGNTRAPALGSGLMKLLQGAWRIASLKQGATQISSGTIYLTLLDEDIEGEVLRQYVQAPEFLKLKHRQLADALPGITARSVELPSPPTPPPASPRRAPKVFLSYRRSDTEPMAQTLYYCLLSQVQGIQVFRDNNSLQPGEVFAEVIRRNIADCDVMVLLIGPRWLGAATEDGQPRLAQASDFVRLEIAEALRQGKTLVPCLVDGARMPAPDELPADIRALSDRHATPLSTPGFHRDVEPLVATLQRWAPGAPLSPAT